MNDQVPEDQQARVGNGPAADVLADPAANAGQVAADAQAALDRENARVRDRDAIPPPPPRNRRAAKRKPARPEGATGEITKQSLNYVSTQTYMQAKLIVTSQRNPNSKYM